MFGIKRRREVGIIINPAAARNGDAGNVARRYETIARSLRPVVWVSNSLNDLYGIAEEFRKEGLKYLVLAGGNGTFHHSVSRFKNVYKGGEIPPVLMLKSGHVNTIAESLKLTGEDDDILQRFAAAMKSRQTPLLMRRNLIKIEDRYCVLFGCGLATSYMDLYYELGEYTPRKAFEVLTHMMSLLRNPSSREARKVFAPFPARVLIEGKPWKRKNLLGCVALTIPTLGLGFNPGSRTLERDGAFQLICTSMKPVDLVTQIFRLYSGTPIEDPDHFDDLVENVTIEAREPFEYTMDGEMYDAIYELRITTSRTGVNLIYV